MNKYEDEKRRADQLSVNCHWLIAKTDEICYALCPGFVGTWQKRAKMAAKKANEISEIKIADIIKSGVDSLKRRCSDDERDESINNLTILVERLREINKKWENV